jgi:uncharacterized membrane protein HdeD (DUF308 family)
MHEGLLYAAAVLAVAVAVTHSLLGERYLIGPILAEAAPGAIVLRSRRSRRILRFAWHLTSLSWIAEGALFAIAASMPPAQSRPIAAVIGASFLLSAVISIAISRGRHVGWPMLAAVGLEALASIVV